MKKILLNTFSLFLISTSFINAQTCSSSGSGDFTTPSTWGVSNLSECSSFEVATGHTVTISQQTILHSGGITVRGSLVINDMLDLGTGGFLTVKSGGDLSGSGSILSGSNTYTQSVSPTFADIENQGYLVNGTLPIELLSFSGKHVDNTIQLHWRTAGEQDNDFMEIQRSKDGKTFESIGLRQGAGNSYTPRDYTFTDEQPMPGVNYYRLRQVDFDGKFEYHPVIAVLFRTDEDKAQGITLFPTVVNDQVNLALNEETTSNGNILISNLNGRVLLRTPFGRGMQQLTIPVNQLPKGQYILTVHAGRTSQTARFIKE